MLDHNEKPKEAPTAVRIWAGESNEALAKESAYWSSIGIKHIVFPNREMLARWRKRIAALATVRTLEVPHA